MELNRIVCGLALAALCFAGCEKKDADQAMARGKAALNTAKAVLDPAVAKLASQAQSAYDSGSKIAMEQARDRAVDLQNYLKAHPDQQADIDISTAAVKAEIAKLDAALAKLDIENKMKALVDKARTEKDEAGKSVEDVKKRLSDTNAEYRDLQDKLDKAQVTLKTASSILSGATDQAK